MSGKMLFCVVGVLLLQILHIHAVCPDSAVETRCTIKSKSYKGMCNCSDQSPAYCGRNEDCKTCILITGACDPASAPECCPIENGNTYCNHNTRLCETTRYCDPKSPCPFDDLSKKEIKNVVAIIKTSRKFSMDIYFPIVRIQEPKKFTWNSGGTENQRLAFAAIFDATKNLLSEVLVDLRSETIVSKLDLPNVLPPPSTTESELAIQIMLNDHRLKDSFSNRNLNLSYATAFMWNIGSSGPTVNLPGKRLLRGVNYYYHNKANPYFWTPIEGLEVTVDLNKKAVDKYLDIENVPVAPTLQILENFNDKPPLKPLLITQSEGSSIQVKGQQIEWYKWKLRYSVDPIHGLQLYHIRYNGDCSERLVIYKISLAEMFVPYGAHGKTWRWRNPFDLGEYGIGKLAQSLTIGEDVPENSILFNCTMADDSSGNPIKIPGCFAAYEKDIGILYKHVNTLTGESVGRRGRQMILTLVATVGNYDYAYDYMFSMDGMIEVQVRLTGIPLARGVSSTSNDATCLESCSTIVNDYLIAPAHQHFFNYRIDFDVDGVNNYVTEVDVSNDPISRDNPDGGAFSTKKKIINFEQFRNHDIPNSRSWHIINANSRNKYETPRGYALKPLDITFSHMHGGNQYLSQAEFVKYPFWATAYKDEEQSAGGNYPRTGTPYQGLPRFIKNKEPLENSDVVVWYTFGLTHTTRPEEWPMMNVHKAGFALVPYNFLSQNSEIPLKGRCS